MLIRKLIIMSSDVIKPPEDLSGSVKLDKALLQKMPRLLIRNEHLHVDSHRKYPDGLSIWAELNKPERNITFVVFNEKGSSVQQRICFNIDSGERISDECYPSHLSPHLAPEAQKQRLESFMRDLGVEDRDIFRSLAEGYRQRALEELEKFEEGSGVGN